MKSRLLFTFILLTVLLNSSCQLFTHFRSDKQDLPEAIKSKAEEFLLDIPEEYLQNFGINDYTEIKNATLGKPVEVYTLENDSLVFANTWRIPFVSDKEYKALITVIKDSDNQYEVVDFGAQILARIFDEYDEADNFKGMLRVYELKQDFLILANSNGEFEFYPLPGQNDKKYTLNELIETIQQQQ